MIIFCPSRFIIIPIFPPDVSQNEVQEKEVIVGIVTDIDLLHHVAKMTRRGSSPDIDSGSGGSGGNFRHF